MSDVIKKYPTKKQTILHILCLLLLPFISHNLFSEAYLVSFFVIPLLLSYSWLEELSLDRTENKREYIIVRTFVKLIPLISGIIAIKVYA